MPKKVFISFRGEDEFKVNTLRGRAQFKNVSFIMDDVSLRKAIDSKDDTYIRGIIRPKIRECDICLCMIGENTYRSRKWVPLGDSACQRRTQGNHCDAFQGLIERNNTKRFNDQRCSPV